MLSTWANKSSKQYQKTIFPPKSNVMLSHFFLSISLLQNNFRIFSREIKFAISNVMFSFHDFFMRFSISYHLTSKQLVSHLFNITVIFKVINKFIVGLSKVDQFGSIHHTGMNLKETLGNCSVFASSSYT